MNYWLIADTHFGHDDMVDFCKRPRNFSERILKAVGHTITNGVMIHLGDICFGREEFWHKSLMDSIPTTVKRWLVLGNHDKKSMSWYMDHGWDFVGFQFTLNIYGLSIVFSHCPVWVQEGQINIHGHFHNFSDEIILKNEPGLMIFRDEGHKLLAMEYTNYQPVSLKTFCFS